MLSAAFHLLKVNFLFRFRPYNEKYDTDTMAQEFLNMFPGHALTVGQMIAFQPNDRKLLQAVVKDLEGLLN